MNIKIGKKIKELRNRDGITQERLAEALGVTNQAISRWESETGYPDIEYILPIANFFEVTIDYLFCCSAANNTNENCEKADKSFIIDKDEIITFMITVKKDNVLEVILVTSTMKKIANNVYFLSSTNDIERNADTGS